MTLSKKRIIILWIPILLILVFLGLRYEKIELSNFLSEEGKKLDIPTHYRHDLQFTSLNITLGSMHIREDGTVVNRLGLVKLGIPPKIGHYKYHLIVATLLVGYALFLGLKENRPYVLKYLRRTIGIVMFVSGAYLAGGVFGTYLTAFDKIHVSDFWINPFVGLFGIILGIIGLLLSKDVFGEK